MTRYRCYVLFTLLLASCAHQGERSGTLADLAKEPLPALPAETAADRERAIAGYREFLRHAEDPMLRAEAMRRLADLSLEAEEERLGLASTPVGGSEQVTTVVVEEQAASQSSAPDPGATAARHIPAAVAEAEPVPQEVPESGETLSSEEAERIIALYEERLRAYPYHPQNDQVLYQLSRAYDNAGRQEDELRVLERLVRQYPNSPDIAEAQFRRGEILFVRKRYSEADGAYRAVLGRGPQSGFYEQALYKRAWSLFKQGLYLEGIDYFLALIDLKSHEGRLQLERLSRVERETIEDTLRAISLSFSYLEGPDSVAEYFRLRGHRKDEDILYRALGEEYLKKDRFSDAAATFQAFVAAYPNSDQGPQFQLRAIDAYRAGGFPSQVLEAQKAFVRLYDLRSPFWQRRRPEDHPTVVAQLESSLHDLARHYHAQAQKSGEEGDFASAADWYQRFLSNFPTSRRAQEVRFLYAELLYEHKRYAEAAEQYLQVAYGEQRNARSAEAAYAAVLSLEELAKRATGDQRLPARRQVLAAASQLAGEYPRHEHAISALAHSAQQTFELGDGAAAAAAARQLLTLDRVDAATRLIALRIIGHSAFDVADYAAAEAAYREGLRLLSPGSDEHRQIGDRLAASIYKQGERQRQNGELAAAAATFLRAAQEVPDSAMAATAQFDAAAVLIELEQWPEAITALQNFRRRFPGHEQQAEVTRRLAAALLAAGRSEEAAAEYLQVAEAAATPELAQAAMWQAGELYRQAGKPEQAYAVFRRYVHRFPQPFGQNLEAQQQLLELSLEMGHFKSARSWRLSIIRADAEAGAQRTDRSRFLAAQAALALAEQPYAEYAQLRLVEPLQENLRKKQAAFRRALRAYERAASYKVAGIATAANYAIAALYADFGKALLESERPRGLKGEALAEYEVLLEEQAMPFEEKAIELHEVNASRTAEGIYDQWVRKSLEALAELMPVRYAKTERGEHFVETIR